MIVTRVSRSPGLFIIGPHPSRVNPVESRKPLRMRAGRGRQAFGKARLYTMNLAPTRGTISAMRLRLAVLPLLLSLMPGLACTIAKERPARTFSEATGGEALERIFWKEVQAADWTAIERVLASNYMSIAPGASLDRTATLEQYRQWKLTDFAIADLKTEMNGPTFTVTYTITLNGTAAGQPLPSPQHMMTVWHQHKSGWMVIAHSASQP